MSGSLQSPRALTGIVTVVSLASLVIVHIPHIRKLRHIRFGNSNTVLIIVFTAALPFTGKRWSIFQGSPSAHSY